MRCVRVHPCLLVTLPEVHTYIHVRTYVKVISLIVFPIYHLQAAFDAAFTVLIAQTSVKANPFNSGLDAVVQVAGCFDVSVMKLYQNVHLL